LGTPAQFLGKNYIPCTLVIIFQDIFILKYARIIYLFIF
jgi:hypothetical protein